MMRLHGMLEFPKRAGGKRNAQEAQLDSPTDAQLMQRAVEIAAINSDEIIRDYQTKEVYVPEEPPKTAATKKKHKAPSRRMITSTKRAKLPF